MKVALRELAKRVRLVEKTDSCEVYDLSLENLALSVVVLHEGESTTGHYHGDTAEIHFFIQGKGEARLNNRREDVARGDFILIPKGVYHQVFNEGGGTLVFLSFFEECPGRGRKWNTC